MTTKIPAPLNLAAMADAWEDPVAFAAQIATYYAQLEREGFRSPTPDITNERNPQDD